MNMLFNHLTMSLVRRVWEYSRAEDFALNLIFSKNYGNENTTYCQR